MNAPSTKGEFSEIGTYGMSRFEIQRDGLRCAVFDKIEDAILFRASEDMLVALDGLLAVFEYHKEPEKVAAANAARAAIAKARG